MAENKNMEVWLAPIGQTRVVMPYRISVGTQVGTSWIVLAAWAVVTPLLAARLFRWD